MRYDRAMTESKIGDQEVFGYHYNLQKETQKRSGASPLWREFSNISNTPTRPSYLENYSDTKNLNSSVRLDSYSKFTAKRSSFRKDSYTNFKEMKYQGLNSDLKQAQPYQQQFEYSLPDRIVL